jgi:hypothetical protein
MSGIFSEEDLEEVLDKVDQEAQDKGTFETTNKIRKEFGIPQKRH